jgi:PAS domain S-box-containing protein
MRSIGEGGDLFAAHRAVNHALSDLIALQIRVGTDLERDGLQTEKRAVWMMTLTGLAGMLLAITLGITLSRSITVPLSKISLVAQEVAKTPLRAVPRVDIASKDEIGLLAIAFNHMNDELKQTMEKLRVSEERHREIYENAPEGIFQASLEGKILTVNPALARIMGFASPAEMTECPTDGGGQLFGCSEDHAAMLAVILERGEISGQEFPCRRMDGEDIWVSISAHVARTDAGAPRFIEGFVSDITERKHAEKERERLDRAHREALSRIRILTGMLPICCVCKKIRDDEGYWNQVEAYITAHSEAEFTHSICPECAAKMYPDFCDKNRN